MSFIKPIPSTLCFKVLVVDDHPGTAKTLARAIAQVSPLIEVIPVTSGSEALRQVMTHTIDILITDVNMPGMSGLDLVKRLQNHSLGQPTYCFLMTASETPELIVASKLLRVSEVFFKPCRPERICQAVAKAIETLGQTKPVSQSVACLKNNLSIDIEMCS